MNAQMNVMPHQLAKFIELAKQKITMACYAIEQYEMTVDLLEQNLILKRQMEASLEVLRKENAFANRKIREALFSYESILKADEEANGWKGPDRWVDFSILQKKISEDDNYDNF